VVKNVVRVVNVEKGFLNPPALVGVVTNNQECFII